MTENGGSAEGPGSMGRNDVSEAFELLQSPRRRYALAYLAETDDEVVELDELAEQVLSCERRNAGADGETRESDAEFDGERPHDATQDVYNDLYHAHVPRLGAAGIATYEEADDAVRVETVPEPVTRFLDLAKQFERGE